MRTPTTISLASRRSSSNAADRAGTATRRRTAQKRDRAACYLHQPNRNPDRRFVAPRTSDVPHAPGGTLTACIAWHTAPVASPVDYLFGLWKPYPFAIWTPLQPEQAAVQLERSLVNRRWDAPGSGLLALHGSVATGRFRFRPRDFRFSRQQPVINGQIVNAPGSGSYVVGELAYGPNDQVKGAVVPVVLTALFGLCGISFLVSDVSVSSGLIAAAPCAGVPTLCLGVLTSITIRTSRYHKRLRAHLCSVLQGVDVTTQEQLSHS